MQASADKVERRKRRNLQNLEHNRRKADDLITDDPFRARKYQKRVGRTERDIAQAKSRRSSDFTAEGGKRSWPQLAVELRAAMQAVAVAGQAVVILDESEDEVEPIPGLFNDAILGAHYKNIPSDMSTMSDEDSLEHCRDQHSADLYNQISHATGADRTGVDGFPPWGAVSWSGDCSVPLSKDDPERGKLEWFNLDEEEVIPFEQPPTLVMKGWSSA